MKPITTSGVRDHAAPRIPATAREECPPSLHAPRRVFMPMPTSKNIWQRMHWAARGRIKRQWETLVWAQLNAEPRMPRPVVSVTVDLFVEWDKPGPLPDHHNLDMAHECIADGLVKAGILADDADGVYQRGGFEIVRVSKGEGQTVVTIEVARVCPECRGDGRIPDESGGGHHGTCKFCGGSKVVTS